MVTWLRHLFGLTLPAPEPRCVVTNWGQRSGKPWMIAR